MCINILHVYKCIYSLLLLFLFVVAELPDGAGEWGKRGSPNATIHSHNKCVCIYIYILVKIYTVSTIYISI